MTDDDEAASRSDVNPRWVAWAALGGSLIGALTGLAGSLLVYKQAEDNREATAHQRTSDVRRAAYGELVNSFQRYKTETNGYRNLLNEDAEAQELLSHYNGKVVPAFSKMQQAESLGRLVGTGSARASIKQMSALDDKVGEIFAAETVDLNRFDVTMAEFTKVVDAFVYRVDQEII
ncbi:hypothetical protein ACFYRY_20130 [Streptomyces sp. NPDC005263]|uniref:hypothetical protein n=1 Tax=Streptomyces sp. NPDC005263 TaxID=3364711 RepID=UPI0036BC30F3